MVAVVALSYFGVSVSDPEAWMKFGTEILGLMPAGEDDGLHRLRADQRAWRIAAREGPENDICFAGFEVADHAALEGIHQNLLDQGIDVQADDGALAADRGVIDMITCRDPDGLAVEIFHGATERFETPFISPQAVNGFVTGDQGLGHIVLGTDDITQTRRFYLDGLGFRLSDVIRMEIGGSGSVELEFYHCNPRHHTLAFIPLRPERRLRHFMLQATTMDDVGFALDRVLNTGIPLASTLGRHTNDHMISFYALTPAGIEVEFGYGARVVDVDNWRTALHFKPSIWGHERH
jgi:2,3-dihydroxybiphenyl 1,2-dioxygenase